MKLGPGLDLIETIPFKNIVDIYKVNGERVARRWPGHPHQPRTAKQEAHWAKVRACMIWRKQLPSWWLSWWKSVNVPKGYSWDDVLRRSWWRGREVRRFPTYDIGPDIGFVYDGWVQTTPFWLYPVGLYLHGPQISPVVIGTGHCSSRVTEPGKKIPLNWVQSGWKCYRGKKRKPQYEIDWSGWTYGGHCYSHPERPSPSCYLGNFPLTPRCIYGVWPPWSVPEYKKTLHRPGVVINNWVIY